MNPQLPMRSGCTRRDRPTSFQRLRRASMVACLLSLAHPGVSGARELDGWDCFHTYYRAGRPQDYEKAYEVCKAVGERDFLIIMQLNGEGVPADVGKAEGLLDAWL